MVGNEEELRKVFTGISNNMVMSVTHLDEDTWTAVGVRTPSCPNARLMHATLPGH